MSIQSVTVARTRSRSRELTRKKSETEPADAAGLLSPSGAISSVPEKPDSRLKRASISSRRGSSARRSSLNLMRRIRTCRSPATGAPSLAPATDFRRRPRKPCLASYVLRRRSARRQAAGRTASEPGGVSTGAASRAAISAAAPAEPRSASTLRASRGRTVAKAADGGNFIAGRGRGCGRGLRQDFSCLLHHRQLMSGERFSFGRLFHFAVFKKRVETQVRNGREKMCEKRETRL